VKRFVSLTIIILALAFGAWAQIGPATNSFRNASTSGTGLIEDDLDLLIGYRGFLDPSRIQLVEGKRLYTSLANIVDKNENVFQPNDNGYFLIGGSTKLMNYGSVGAFYDRLGRSTPLVLDPAVYGTMVGHGERTDVILSNPGGQTIQDVIKRTADANSDLVSTQLLFGLGHYMWETKRVGIAFYHSDNSQETKVWGDITPARRFGNYTYSRIVTNLVTGQITENDTMTGTQKAGDNASRNLIGLAGWMPYGEKYSLGLQIMTGLVSTSPNDEAKYDGTFNRTGIETQTLNGIRKLAFTESGLTFDTRLSAIYKWSDATDSRVDLGFGMTNAKNKSGDKLEVMTSESYTSTFFTSTADTDNVAFSGTKDNAGRLDFFARTTSKLSDRVTFGMGFGVNSSNLETKLIGDETRTIVTVYRQNAGGQSPFDSTATTTWTEKDEIDTTGSNLVFSIPVGLEFHLTDPVVFRLGANHRITSSDLTVSDQVVSWSPPRTRVVFGDGRSYELTTLPGPFVSRSNTVKVKSSQTTYTYGAGWNYSDRLQLDFMGFAHLDDLTNWKLSATFKF
jgi:hypothetical protein